MPPTQRSEKTRTAILTAARRLLADRGYEGTTIRAVAAAAEIDPSMVMRYYGNKEGLFAAAVDVDLRLPDVAAYPREEVGGVLARHLVSRWEDDRTDELLVLLLRSAATTPVAAEQLRSVFARQVLGAVRAATGDGEGDGDGDGEDTARRAALLATQVLGVALCRYVLELPPLVAMDGDALAAVLAPVLQHYLFGDLLRDAPAARERGRADRSVHPAP